MSGSVLVGDWSAVGLGSDPCPGDVDAVRALAARLGSYAELAASNGARLRQVSGDVAGGPLRMRGDYARGYAEAFEELPGELAKLEKAYRGVAAALGRFAGRLDDAQAKARSALSRGEDARSRFWSARNQANGLLPAGTSLPWGRESATSAGLTPAHADAATAGLDDATRSSVRAAVSRAISAKADQSVAARLAREAAALRGDAEHACVEEIHDALDGSGIKNRSWWQKAWDAVSAPFRSWDAFVSLCEKVALVAGVVALFVSGPLGWAIMAASIAAGAVILADKIDKYARGEASLLDVGLAVLGVLPFKPGAALELAGGLRAGLEAFRGGAGKAFGEGLFGLRTALPHGLEVAGGLRGAAEDPVLFGRAMLCRAFGADPIDLATGEMVVDATDVDLPVGPGMPGVRLRRVHQSSYRVGHRFGREWNTSLDHRLEVDDAGVVYTGADGMVLVFPHVADGVAVVPSHGPRLRLTRSVHPDPRSGVAETYAVHDPVSGLTEVFSAAGGVAGVTALPIVAVTDRAGRRVEYRYDPDGFLTGIVQSDAAGRAGYRVRVETVAGRVASLTVEGRREPDVTLVRYGYDAAGRLTHVYNSSGRALGYAYDAAGRVVQWTDRNGTWYGYRYDETGRCTAAEGTDGVLRARLEYDVPDPRVPDGGTATRFTDSLGGTSLVVADAARQVVRRVDPLGHEWTRAWDARNLLLAETDPLGRTTRWTYDGDGRETSLTLPDGTSTSAGHDDRGLPVTLTDPAGAVTTTTWDDRGLLAARTDALGATTTYGWDDAGTLATVSDPSGSTTTVVCDPAGLPVRVTDATGVTTRVDRDPLGRPAAVVDPAGGVTTLAWDVEGHLRERVDAAGARWTWAYDAEGSLREAVDPLAGTTTVVPTAWDQAAAVTAPDGATTTYAYDTERRLTRVTNPQGLTWHYRYDPAGRLVGETDFDGRAMTFTRDAAGQVTSRSTPSGTTEFLRDPAGRVVRETAVGTGSAVVVETTFAYDAGGRLVRAANPDADVVLTRDVLGRVVAETTTDARGSRTLTNTYDVAGRRIERRTPAGAVSTWTWDAAGRPASLDTGLPGGRLDLGHDHAGRESTRRTGAALLGFERTPTGLLATQTLTAGDGGTVLQRRYGYADDGYLTRIDEVVGAVPGTTTLALDPLRRITSVLGPAGTERYEHDASGTVVDADWPSAAEPDGSGARTGPRQVTGTRVTRAGRTTYEDDPAGRLVRRRTRSPSGGERMWTFGWDARDRLVECRTPDGALWRYAYDALGRRTAKLGPDGTVVFTWDGGTLAEETSSGPDGRAASTTWDHTPDGVVPLAQRDQGWFDARFHAIVTDVVGRPTELVAPDGQVVWRRVATVWAVASEDTDGDRPTCRLLFPGQYADAETGLADNVLRSYDPALSGYCSPDPLGLAGGARPTGYVHNPTARVDLLGLVPYGELETFFRGMSQAEYDVVRTTRGIVPRGENFVTQDLGYVQQLAARHPDKYPLLVEFALQPGTRQALVDAGLRADGGLFETLGLSHVGSIRGAGADVVHLKAELDVLTFGLRSGSAHVFNDRIVDFWLRGWT